MPIVTVHIEWPPELERLPRSARARVTVEDTSLADAASVVVGETVLRALDTSHPAVAEVEVGDVDPRADLSVRVHVTAGERAIAGVERGDLVTVESHPVLTHGHGTEVVVRPRLVQS